MSHESRPEPESILDAASSFLAARQQVIRLAPLDDAPWTGYIWRKVFLKPRRAH